MIEPRNTLPVKVHDLAPDLTIYEGDVREVLKTLPDESVQCVVTSPPYFGLRDYGTAQWEGGDPNCDHDEVHRWDGPKQTQGAQSGHASKIDRLSRQACPCGARRIDNQIGLEPTPEAYVQTMVELFREVRRVLRKDGTCWLNLGDSYSGSGVNDGTKNPGLSKAAARGDVKQTSRPNTRIDGLKPKDLVGIPWRTAFALQADGWWLRSDIIWNKPNPMPESVTDRPTKAHEYIFLLTKSATYFYDHVAIQEPSVGQNLHDITGGKYAPPGQPAHTGSRPPSSATFKREGSKREAVIPGQSRGTHRPDREDTWPTGTRNKRSVWSINTRPFSEAHFAVFPEELPRTCILAGTSPKACPTCGAPWERAREVVRSWRDSAETREQAYPKGSGNPRLRPTNGGMSQSEYQDLGWTPACTCEGNDGSGKCRVLDIFHGSGTTGEVAMGLGRSYWGCELNPKYIELSIRARLSNVQTSLLGQL